MTFPRKAALTPFVVGAAMLMAPGPRAGTLVAEPSKGRGEESAQADTADNSKCSGGLLSSVDFLVVFNEAPNNDASANRVFTVKKSSVPWLVKDLRSTKAAGDINADVSDHAAELAKMSSTRWQSVKGDKLFALLFYPDGNTPVIRFAETARASRIETDIQSLIQILAKVPKAAATTDCSVKTYTLQQERANLAVTAMSSNSSDKSADTLKAAIVTGPREALFLSANAGLTKASQVTYDQSTQALGPAQTPKSFYIGANWSVFRDLYDDESAQGFWDEFAQTGEQLYLGVFVEGSTRPLNQVGALLGFRWLPFISDYVPVKTVSPFVGFARARSDTITVVTPNGPKVETHFGPAKLIVGLSLNLSQALSWLGAGSSSSGSSSGKGGGS